jgi:hypothetical protein
MQSTTMSDLSQHAQTVSKDDQIQQNIADSFAELGTGLYNTSSNSINNDVYVVDLSTISFRYTYIKNRERVGSTLICGICCGGSCRCMEILLMQIKNRKPITLPNISEEQKKQLEDEITNKRTVYYNGHPII